VRVLQQPGLARRLALVRASVRAQQQALPARRLALLAGFQRLER
jgi:hypothetical protein